MALPGLRRPERDREHFAQALVPGVVNNLWQSARKSHASGRRGFGCPFCDLPMSPVTHLLPDGGEGEVEIDACLPCTALWFDGSELEKMGGHFALKLPPRTRLKMSRQGSQAPVPSGAGAPPIPVDFSPHYASDLVDFIGEALSGIFGG